jgi:membrane fusion protein (multidrug efflux system)
MRALSPNPDRSLLPGQFAKVELIFSTLEEALMVPSEAVIPELGGYKIYISRSGTVESKVVEVGIRTESQVQVISGLQPQDTIITSGILQIRPGSSVDLTLTE